MWFFRQCGKSGWDRARRLPMNRWTYWHSTAASMLNLVVALYLLWHGAIGLMTWA